VCHPPCRIRSDQLTCLCHCDPFNYEQLTDKQFIRKNFGVLVALAVVYCLFLTSLSIARYRRTVESLDYLM
jgi:hypothetical protein